MARFGVRDLALLCLLLGPTTWHQAQAACSLPAAAQATWYKADTKSDITITSSTMTGHKLKHGSSVDYTGGFNCHSASSDSYIFKTDTAVDGPGGPVDGYLCWKLVQASDYAFLLYELTATASSGSYINERVKEVDGGSAAPSNSEVCSLSFTSVVPILLYKKSGGALTPAATAQTKCSPELFADFSYVKDASECQGMDTTLAFCPERMTAKADYAACSTPILYSSGGLLSCVAHTTVQSAVYQMLVNQDASPDGSTSYQFVCLKVTKSGDVETGTVYADSCGATTQHSLQLTARKVQCPEEDDSSGGGDGGGGDDGGGMDLMPIIIGAVVGVVLIAAIIVGAVLIYKLWYKRRKQKRNAVEPSDQDGKPADLTAEEGADLPPKEGEPTPNGNVA